MPESDAKSTHDPLFYMTSLSPFGTRVRLVQAFTGQRLPETPAPGGSGSQEMKAISYFGKVPAITVGDRTLIESLPLMEYLVERAGGHALVPESPEERAVMRGMMLAHDHYVLGAIWPMFVSLRSGKPDVVVITAALEAARAQYQVLVATFSNDADFAVGPSITLADLAMAPFAMLNGMMYAKFGVADPHADILRLERWKRRTMSVPEVASVVDALEDRTRRAFG